MDEGLFIAVSRDNGDSPVVTVRGEVDLATASQLAEVLDEVVGATLDLSELAFMDCSAVSALLKADSAAKAVGRRLRIRRASSAVLLILRTLGLDQVLDMGQDVSRR
jgi:anti-sigma B factor antagonist